MKFFPVLKSSIIIILEEDKKKKEELELRKTFSKAIAGFEGKGDVAEPEGSVATAIKDPGVQFPS